MVVTQSENVDRLKKIWREKPYSTGLPVIDLQHIWLINIIMKMQDALLDIDLTGLNTSLKEAIVQIVDYVAEHFSLEEEILKQFQFPDYQKHRGHHLEFVQKLKDKLGDSEDDQVKALGLINILKHWLLNHILKEDKHYADFLEKNISAARTFCQDILNSKKYNITREQVELFKEINPGVGISEVMSENIAEDVRHIWKSYNLAIHVPIIDLQHAWLLKLVVELDKAVKTMGQTRKNEIFLKTVGEALEYTKEHFSTEESLMKQFRFPDLVNHFNQHKRFIEFIKQRNEENKHGDSMAASHLVQDLKTWLLSHIALEDKKLYFHLKDKHKDVVEFVRRLHESGELVVKTEYKELYKYVVRQHS